MRILLGYGTRPEYIKVKPLIDELKKHHVVDTVRFLQHKDLVSTDASYEIVIPEGHNRLDSIIGSINNIPDSCFSNIDLIIVQGDTYSALTLALAASNRRIKIAHLEAGLRTYDKDNPYPEEHTRQIISRIADVHFCPTVGNAENLRNEGITRNLFVVGNTVLDNLMGIRDKITFGNEVYITLHRRENLPQIEQWFSALNRVAGLNPSSKFILPIHPNPEIRRFKNMLDRVIVVEPIPYEEFLPRMVEAKYFITDSGGIQEESAYLGKKCIILRKVTERPEVLNLGSKLCTRPDELETTVAHMELNYKGVPSDVFGIGYSSKLIADILLTEFNSLSP